MTKFGRAYLYGGLGPRFELALDFFRTFDAKTPAGKVALAGDDVYEMVQSYGTSPASERKWEPHRLYVDVQAC
jgi:biofilm protein TabA